MGSVLKPLKNSKYPSLCQLKHPQNDQYAIPAGCRELKKISIQAIEFPA
jgi:hypothetical protein